MSARHLLLIVIAVIVGVLVPGTAQAQATAVTTAPVSQTGHDDGLALVAGHLHVVRFRSPHAAEGGGAASRVIHAGDLSSLPKAAPGTDTVVLGPFTREVKVALPGGREVSAIQETIETTLQPAAQQLGGRTLSRFPGKIEALAPEIQKADRIIFFTTEGKLGPLTQAEMDLIQSSAELRAKTTFVYGAIQ